ncbi:hypothetical protein [Acinetobacter sp. HY1485]|uniref:hypothetical protein n=1 Tax=Acinetobacter sp. HY1485 TaxID=2970918 RepID=UPI0022B9CBBC|nr:hypothetical protein [Acinetobacter sp. HY1485]
MQHHYHAFLTQTAPQQEKSIKAYRLENGTKVWLKKSVSRHSKWLYMLVQSLAHICQLDLLLPVRNYGGKEAIQCEAKRLDTLANLGIRVPKVLATSDMGLLIEDMASHDKNLCQLDKALAQETNFEKRKELFKITVYEIQKVHNKKQYLSEAFARNILVDSHRNISFIDFETDPATVFDLKTSQTRDWLCFLFSTTFRFSELERVEIIQLIKKELTTDTLSKLYQLGRRFAWLNKIGVENFGNDGKRLKIFLLFLENLGKR